MLWIFKFTGDHYSVAGQKWEYKRLNETKEEKDSGDQKQWQWYWLKIHSGSEGGGILQQCWKIRRIKCNFKTKIYLCLWDNFGYSSLDPKLFQVPLNQEWLKYQDREMSGFFSDDGP